MREFFEWRDAPQAEFAVIGDPVGHSLSPQMHQAAYDALGLGYRYGRVRVPPGEVAEALEHLAALGYKGVNVTLPLKEEAFRWATQPDVFTKRIGAANTLELSTKRATNTDGPGFMDTIEPLALPVPSRVLVLGAGGTARSILPKLVDAGQKVSLYNRTREKAEKLAEDLSLHCRIVDAPATAGFRLIVNATSAEAKGETLAVQWSDGAGCTAYDTMYMDSSNPLAPPGEMGQGVRDTGGTTSFLAEAAAHGWHTIDGRALLVAQGARSFAWWLGIDPPREVMLRAVLHLAE